MRGQIIRHIVFSCQKMSEGNVTDLADASSFLGGRVTATLIDLYGRFMYAPIRLCN